ncbi:Rhodanese-like domain-containing protein [Biscogniauxia mediterranea]|nr:Rhodanese-like domain-containing protein [Biscogniauxia mediterranea]
MAPPRHQLLTLGIRSTARSTGSTNAMPARAGAGAGATTALRTFGSSTSNIPRRAAAPRTITREKTLPRQPLGTGIRWSSSGEGAGGNRIWTFEEISALSSSSSSGSSPSSKPAILIDVREPAEVAATGRIPGALNVPISSAPDSFHADGDDFAARHGFARPPRDRELVFYCKAGVRSRAAATIARDAGWAAVGEYPGSWVEWHAKGGKVER